MQTAMEVPPDPSEIRTAIPQISRKTAWGLPLALFVLTAGLYALSWVAIFRVPWPERIPMSLLNGFLVGVLFVVGHDACHGAFTSARWLNETLGRLAFLPSAHPFSFWELGHNRLHHGWANLKGKDYVWAPLSKREFDESAPARRHVERAGRTFFGVALHYAVVIWWAHMAFPSPEDRARVGRWVGPFDRLCALAFAVAQTLVAFELEAPGAFANRFASAAFFGVLLPFMTFNWLAGFLTFMHHTHERVRWYDRREDWSFARGALFGTVHVIFPAAIDIALYNIMFHTAHHVDTRVPLYRLPSAQRAIEAAHGDSVIRYRFALSPVLATFRRCKLYDYRCHRWLDFAGNPTAPV
jgi:omega-6 fatty acid desaturase (delta-12 desaturase)